MGEQALAQQPVAVAIEADQTSFQFYKGGVLKAKKGGVKLDHGVLAVGYGVDPKTKMKYWIVKNSWGPMWGDHGYIMMEKEPAAQEGQEARAQRLRHRQGGIIPSGVSLCLLWSHRAHLR